MVTVNFLVSESFVLATVHVDYFMMSLLTSYKTNAIPHLQLFTSIRMEKHYPFKDQSLENGLSCIF